MQGGAEQTKKSCPLRATALVRVHAPLGYLVSAIRQQDGLLYAHRSQQALSVRAESMRLLMWPELVTREVILKGDRQSGECMAEHGCQSFAIWGCRRRV